MPLDEATTRLLTEMGEHGRPLHEMTPEEARQFSSGLREIYGHGPEMAAVTNRRIKVAGGWIKIRILTPRDDPAAVVVYYHGGGWVVGNIDECDTLGRKLAAASGCAVILVDYRLAPEYRYPTAVEDAWAGLLWAEKHLVDIAGREVPLVVAGDSAGGNLAAVMAQRSRDRGGPSLSCQVLVYPVTDCDLGTTSYLDPANQLLLTRDSMRWFWDHYAPIEASRTHSDASPLRVGDLSRLPRTVILTAEHDVLRDEGEIYATRMLKAGVQVEHRRFEGQMHGFFTMVNVLPGSAAGVEFVAAALRRELAPAPASASA